MAITKSTAAEIALAYREVEVGEELLAKVREEVGSRGDVDIRDVFGRRTNELQLGVPSGNNSQRLFAVPYSLAIPVIEAHIAHHGARIAALSEKARCELVEQVA